MKQQLISRAYRSARTKSKQDPHKCLENSDYFQALLLEELIRVTVNECASVTEEPGNLGRFDLDWRLVFSEYFEVEL